MRINRPSRRVTIILLIAAALLITAGLYAWQSALAWSGYERRLVTEKAAYEQLRKRVTSGMADDRLKAVRELDDKLTGRGKLCHMNGLYAWQAGIVPQLRDGVASCKASVKRLDALSGPLGALRDYLDAAEKLRTQVATLAPTVALTEKNWAELGLKKAQQAQQSIRKLSSRDKDADKLIEQATRLSDQLVKAWQTLLSANEAKDKTAFLSASASLARAYAEFAGLADTADADIADKAQAALKAAGSPTHS